MTSIQSSKIKNQVLLSNIEAPYLKPNVPNIRVGDNVKLGVQITEGSKTRVQAYEGVVISIKNTGINKTITVRKIMQGIGIERCFLIHSPKINSIQILSSAKVRRSKLYYLRNLSGKATRLKQRFN
jgi:large subunit ribosomal protein L19|uniref:Large ribosomal subunit protein bL19c n=1 Tax=Pseudopedinella elastica TaxID=35684 RepID=A0A516ZAD0_9STRA|nr:ribosomal protein L19 [Pseudopedinella elastica]QDR24664.1 ribosomal protein L19 [Pseudopedinella elastica]|tara:strand:+ start:1032 stop:1409 length:378 start_codon:yes stop_codon:yes gene_type:complete